MQSLSTTGISVVPANMAAGASLLVKRLVVLFCKQLCWLQTEVSVWYLKQKTLK